MVFSRFALRALLVGFPLLISTPRACDIDRARGSARARRASNQPNRRNTPAALGIIIPRRRRFLSLKTSSCARFLPAASLPSIQTIRRFEYIPHLHTQISFQSGTRKVFFISSGFILINQFVLHQLLLAIVLLILSVRVVPEHRRCKFKVCVNRLEYFILE